MYILDDIEKKEEDEEKTIKQILNGQNYVNVRKIIALWTTN